jgi:hypothetical protein
MYTETEFEKLIKSVETEFSAHLAEIQSTGVSLAKAEDGGKKPPEKKEAGKEEKAPEAPSGEKKPEGEAPPAAEGKEAPAPAAEAPTAAPGEAAPPADAQAAAPGAEGHDYDAEDLAHMQKMYMSMSKAELMAHHDACRAALDAQGMGKCGDSPAEAAPMAPAAPAAPAFGKAEITSHDKANGGQISKETVPHSVPGAKSPASKVEGVQMEKSENTELELAKAETAQANAKVENLQKSLDAVSAFLTKLVEKKVAPQGKAITTLDVIAKGEGASEEKTLTKSEIEAKLLAKSQDPKLEKSDRDLINKFYLDGGSLNSISHLLK